MDFRIKEFQATHRFNPLFTYDETRQFFKFGDKIIPITSIKWIYIHDYTVTTGMCYWDKEYKSIIKIWYDDTGAKYLSKLAYVEFGLDVDPTPEKTISFIRFIRELNIPFTTTPAEERQMWKKFKQENSIPKPKKELTSEQMEWRKKHVWPIVKWCLIGFYSLFGLCFLAVIFGII